MTSKVGREDFFLRRNMLTQAISLNQTDGDFNRASGRTLTIGLRLVAQCLQDYNTWFTVSDHHPKGDRDLLRTVFNIVDELDLKGFFYNKMDNKIMFDLKQEYRQNERVPHLLRLGN